MGTNKHYIRVDKNNRIIDGWSDGLRPDKNTSSAILLHETEMYQFQLYMNGPQNPNLYEMHGIPLYKWDGEKVVERTPAEIEADRANLPQPEPTQEERLTALEGKVEGMSEWEQAFKRGVQSA